MSCLKKDQATRYGNPCCSHSAVLTLWCMKGKSSVHLVSTCPTILHLQILRFVFRVFSCSERDDVIAFDQRPLCISFFLFPGIHFDDAAICFQS